MLGERSHPGLPGPRPRRTRVGTLAGEERRESLVDRKVRRPLRLCHSRDGSVELANPGIGGIVEVLTERGERAQGDIRAGIAKSPDNLREALLVPPQGRRLRKALGAPSRLTRGRIHRRLDVVRADQDYDFAGSARDHVVETLQNLPGDVAVDSGIDEGAMRQALAEHLDEVDRRLAPHDARPEAHHRRVGRDTACKVVLDVSARSPLHPGYDVRRGARCRANRESGCPYEAPRPHACQVIFSSPEQAFPRTPATRGVTSRRDSG